MKLTILIISILLIGCSKPVEIECQNITINNTVEIIKYINNTIIKEVNITCQKYDYGGTTSKEIELIRRIKLLENSQDEWIINETECMPHNVTEEDLRDCEDDLDISEDDIDDLEDDLEDCEDELCDINSSWC